MEIKKCFECGKEYESKNTTGQEQKYCSSSCRCKAANKRRENNILEKLRGQIHETAKIGNEERTNERKFEESFSANYGKSFGLSSEKIFELINTNAILSSENKRLQEKIETIEKDYQTLEMDYNELEEKFVQSEKNGNMAGIIDKVTPFVPIIAGIFSNNKSSNNAKAQTA